MSHSKENVGDQVSPEPHDRLSAMMLGGRSFSGHERHCFFLNTGSTRFANLSAVSGLDLPDDGRAVARVDWDHDGDEDLWISNRNAPRLRYLRNDTPAANDFLALRLTGDGKGTNRDAIGARVEVVCAGDQSKKRIKTLRAGEGFLAQSSNWLHFGLGTNAKVLSVTVRWPGKNVEVPGKNVEVFDGIEANQRYDLVQGSGVSRRLPNPKRALSLSSSAPNIERPDSAISMVLPVRVPMLPITFEPSNSGSESKILAGHPRLISLWADWCAPCRTELGEMTARRQEIDAAGLQILALHVSSQQSDSSDARTAEGFLRDIGFPYQSGHITEGSITNLQELTFMLSIMQDPLPLPSSFLIDGQGRLAVIYRGPVSVDTLLADVQRAESSSSSDASPVALLPGSRIDHPLVVDTARRHETIVRFGVASVVQRAGLVDDAVRHYEAVLGNDPEVAEAHNNLGTIYFRRSDLPAALKHFEHAIAINSDYDQAQHNAGAVLYLAGDFERAAEHFKQAVALKPDYSSAHKHLGAIYRKQGDDAMAVTHFRAAAGGDSPSADVFRQLALILTTSDNAVIRDAPSAVKWARMGVAASGPKNWLMQATLARAHAATGQFGEACQILQEAIALSPLEKKPELLRQLADWEIQRQRRNVSPAPSVP